MNTIKLIVRAGPIKNEKKLRESLYLTKEQLDHALSLSSNERYRDPKVLPVKKDGSQRLVKNPIPQIRLIQSKINDLINRCIVQWPDYLHGSIPKTQNTSSRDYISCAAVHCRSKSILKIDISSFFDRIHIEYVSQIFSGLFRYNPTVADKLADLCCYNSYLVQGALTSSYIANLIFWDSEHIVVDRLRRAGLKYTRLVDDITISSNKNDYDFSLAESIVEDMLYSKNLPTNKNKRQISKAGLTPMQVHGVQVNYSKPCFPKDDVKKICAAVKNITNKAKNPNQNQSKSYRNLYFRTLGRVNKLERVKNDRWLKLKNIMVSPSVRPQPSAADIDYCEKMLIWFKKRGAKHSKSFYYRSKYGYVIHLLHFMKNSKIDFFSNYAINKIPVFKAFEP